MGQNQIRHTPQSVRNARVLVAGRSSTDIDDFEELFGIADVNIPTPTRTRQRFQVFGGFGERSGEPDPVTLNINSLNMAATPGWEIIEDLTDPQVDVDPLWWIQTSAKNLTQYSNSGTGRTVITGTVGNVSVASGGMPDRLELVDSVSAAKVLVHPTQVRWGRGTVARIGASSPFTYLHIVNIILDTNGFIDYAHVWLPRGGIVSAQTGQDVQMLIPGRAWKSFPAGVTNMGDQLNAAVSQEFTPRSISIEALPDVISQPEWNYVA